MILNVARRRRAKRPGLKRKLVSAPFSASAICTLTLLCQAVVVTATWHKEWHVTLDMCRHASLPFTEHNLACLWSHGVRRDRVRRQGTKSTHRWLETACWR